jgi:hypothetical protein
VGLLMQRATANRRRHCVNVSRSFGENGVFGRRTQLLRRFANPDRDVFLCALACRGSAAEQDADFGPFACSG